jgi:hypothetical protein
METDWTMEILTRRTENDKFFMLDIECLSHV